VKKPLAEVLLGSTAVKSLIAEQDIAGYFTRAGWYVGHGVYYKDNASGKLRELDVLASQRWIAPDDDGTAVALINLLIECKSSADYHLVFSHASHVPERTWLKEWKVKDRHVAVAIVKRLADAGLRDLLAAKTQRAFLKAAWEHAGVDLAPAPVVPPASVSAFRETNIGIDKELDSSVLWRSVQALASAIASFHEAETVERADEIAFEIQIDLIEGRSPFARVQQELRTLLGFTEYYHPIVITNSQLWLADRGTIDPLGWCRLHLRDKSQMTTGWFDVVHSAALAEYVAELTSAYAAQLRAAHASLHREENGKPAA
jgi:hypothetical protein